MRPSKFEGRRAGRGSVVLKRGRFVEWAQQTIRYDLSNTIDDDDDPPEDDGGASGNNGGSEPNETNGLTNDSGMQQGLPLPMGPGGDA